MELNKLFNPQSIAIVGASEDAGRVGNVIAKNILTLGYQGQVFLVNPKHETLFGKKCYKNLNEIENEVDLAIIVIPAKFVNNVIEENTNRVKNFVVISAGFAEINVEGKAREGELKKIADENNLNILGPNCLGFIIPQLKLNASFAGGMPETGNIAFVSQSGALAVAIMDVAKKENLKFSNIISIGNKMQMDEVALLEYLDKDENTKVIGMYLEGIKDGRKFIKIAQESKKPIVVLKAGKTKKAQKAISSHTAALAGSDEIMDAVFEKVGIIRADNIDEFLSLLKLTSLSDALRSKEVIVITNAGGLGVLTADAFKDKEIKLAEISEKTKAVLRKFLPEESSVENPIDVLGDADEKRYAKTMDILKNENAGAIICLLTPQDQTPVKKIAGKIVKFKEKSGKNIIAVFMGGKRVEKAVEKLKENNIPNYFITNQAINALDKYYQWKANHLETKSPSSGETAIESIARKNKAKEIIDNAKAQGRGALLFAEVAEIMKMYGINTVETFSENTDGIYPVKSAKGGPASQVFNGIVYPVAVKVDSDKILHKTDKQGVILNIKNKEELGEAIVKIKNNFPGEKIIIQPMQKIKTELILGIKKDDTFGPIVVFGLGGIYTEIFKMVDFLIPPAGQEEIKKKISNSKIKFLFQDTRGQKPHNLHEISGVLAGLASLARELPEIKELDINPLLAYNDNNPVVAVDIKAVI